MWIQQNEFGSILRFLQTDTQLNASSNTNVHHGLFETLEGVIQATDGTQRDVNDMDSKTAGL